MSNIKFRSRPFVLIPTKLKITRVKALCKSTAKNNIYIIVKLSFYVFFSYFFTKRNNFESNKQTMKHLFQNLLIIAGISLQIFISDPVTRTTISNILGTF